MIVVQSAEIDKNVIKDKAIHLFKVRGRLMTMSLLFPCAL